MKPFIFNYSMDIKICEEDSGFFLSVKDNDKWIFTHTYSTIQELLKNYPLKASKLSEFYQERFLYIISDI